MLALMLPPTAPFRLAFNLLLPQLARLEAAFRTALADENFKREAARNFMPLNTMVGAEYRAFAQTVDDRLKRLWQVRPWRG